MKENILINGETWDEAPDEDEGMFSYISIPD